jgi:hypothetical protein
LLFRQDATTLAQVDGVMDLIAKLAGKKLAGRRAARERFSSE